MEKEAVMIRAALLALAALTTTSQWVTQPVEAREAPWCAVINNTDDSVYWDCQYYSYEQCRTIVLAGNRGWCNPSPYAAGPAQQKPSSKYRARSN
jgi:hypothetical protein